MKESKFLIRLRSELPVWVKNGWVLETKQQDILDFVADEDQQIKTSSTSLFAIFGVLLFATGVISFFAANWDAIPKLLKLVMLFSAMWGAYALAYVGSKFSSVFLLLGTLLFGANIWLIAQIYHIQAFYPHGVLMWSLGALLAAVLLRDGLTLALSVILAVVWTTLDYAAVNFRGNVHWEFLILWFAQVFFIFHMQKNRLFNLAMLGLVVWSLLTLSNIQLNLYFLQLYVLLACTLFFISTIGITLPRFEREGIFKTFALSMQHWSLFLAFSALYLLAIPKFVPLVHYRPSNTFDFYPAPYSIGLGLTASIMIINVALLLAIFKIARDRVAFSYAASHPNAPLQPRFYFGFILYLGLNILMLGTFFGEGYLKNNSGFFSLFFNIIFFLGSLWLIQRGNELKDRFSINLGCFFFGIGLLTRYFDTFWTLLDRSFFFMIGGLLLLISSYVIEKYRRFFIRKIKDE